METRVVNIRHEKCDVKICRKQDGSIPPAPSQGCFGNPFILHDVNDDEERTRVISQYRDYFYLMLNDPVFKTAVHSLRGKKIGCFCAPKPCHGDVIKEYLEREYNGR